MLAHREPAVTGRTTIGDVVYTKRSVAIGAAIRANDLFIGQADENKIPIDAFRTIETAVGKIAIYGIPSGAIVSRPLVRDAARKNVDTSIELTPDLVLKLQGIAKQQKISVSALAQKLLERAISPSAVIRKGASD